MYKDPTFLLRFRVVSWYRHIPILFITNILLSPNFWREIHQHKKISNLDLYKSTFLFNSVTFPLIDSWKKIWDLQNVSCMLTEASVAE